MRIELQRAFVAQDMQRGPCELCEAEFTPRVVVIRIDPYGYEICEECLKVLSSRKEQYPGAPWPTWEEYGELVETYQEPMFGSPEAMQASENADQLRWPAYEQSWLRRAEEAARPPQ